MTYFWYQDKAYIYDKLVRERERKKIQIQLITLLCLLQLKDNKAHLNNKRSINNLAGGGTFIKSVRLFTRY